MKISIPFLLSAISLLGLLLLAALIYLPGVGGIFLLDDSENLKFLYNFVASADWRDYLGVALTQFSGATRIVPMASFAFQHEAWPNHPGHMIAVNIGIHLVNGALVYFLSRQLATLAGISRRRWIAWLTAAIWLLSPIQVSGTLYIIQRINQLAAFFVFAGTLAYLHGRARAVASPRTAFAWMTAGVVVGGGLAVLSKENGVLIPLLVLVVEATLLRRIPWPSWGRAWRWCLLYLPLIVVVGYLACYVDVRGGYNSRSFTLSERILTECRILLDYLRVILIPRSQGLGLFHDDEQLVRWGSWDVLYVFAMLFLMAAGWFVRERFPVIAFGILWFFAGHALESTVIPLELYFEHRNYLPLFGPAFALAYLWVSALRYTKGIVRMALGILFAAWLGLMAWVTWQQTSLWGVPAALAEVAEFEHPTSVRAILFQAGMLNHLGFKEAAAKRMLRMASQEGGHPEYYLEWLWMGCDGKMRTMPDMNRVLPAFLVMKKSVDTINGLAKLADAFEAGKCPGLEADRMLELTDALVKNPNYASSLTKLNILAGRFLLASGRAEQAVAYFDRAERASGDIEDAFLKVKALHAAGRFQEARDVLDSIQRKITASGVRGHHYLAVMEFWRKQVADKKPTE